MRYTNLREVGHNQNRCLSVLSTNLREVGHNQNRCLSVLSTNLREFECQETVGVLQW